MSEFVDAPPLAEAQATASPDELVTLEQFAVENRVSVGTANFIAFAHKLTGAERLVPARWAELMAGAAKARV